MQLYISDEERRLLASIVERALRDVREELSVSQTNGCRALITPRERLLAGLLGRIQNHNSEGRNHEPGMLKGGSSDT